MANLSLLIAVACLTLFQGSSASMEEAWTAATDAVPPVEHGVNFYYYYTNASETKRQLQAAFQAYLKDVDQTVAMMAGRSVQGLYQQESAYFKMLEYWALHPEQVTPTSYDSALPELGAYYRRLVALVKDGAAASSKTAQQFQAARSVREEKPFVWSPEAVFVGLPDSVGGVVSELRAWTDNLLDAGFAAANGQVAAIMAQKRQEVLLPHVQSAQRAALNAQDYWEDKFQQFSSPDVYQEFVAARQELLDLQLVA